ncbi:MAG: hypothetical protein JWP89_1214 [Schlesneria sp.]|nr:hypothetical protein [Schlesneria sp.]
MQNWMKSGSLLLMLVVIAGCSNGSAGKKPLPTAAVSGTVELAGKPLEDGEIKLLVQGESPSVIAIKAGKFSGNASVGDNHVEIRGFRTGKPIMMNDTPVGEPIRENYIAEQFNDRSTLKAKIEAKGTTDLKFEVESK